MTSNLLWKLPVAATLIGGITVVAAHNVAPQVPIATVLIAAALLLALGFGLVILALIVTSAWHRYCLNHGATDPQWMWFGGEPPGLQRLRRKSPKP